jgi:hypothetical protein
MSPRAGLAAVIVVVLVLAPVGAKLLTSDSSRVGVNASTAALPRATNARAALPVIDASLRPRVPARELARSRHAYTGLAPTGAARLALRTFPTSLAGPPQGSPKLPRGTRITRYAGDRAAQIYDGKHHGLLVSTLPLRVRERGSLRPIDLRLRGVGGALVPRRPLIPARLPERIGAGISFSNLARVVPLTAAGRAGVAARRLGSSRVIYPSIAADTDFIAEPTVLGVETYWQLRSPQSPELQILKHSLGRGVSFQADGEAVKLLRNGHVIGRILPPQAVDASGRPIRVAQKLVGSELQLVVSHRRAGVRYPVLVDPGYVHSGDGYVTDNWYASPTWHLGNANGLEAWSAYSNHPIIYTANECDPTSLASDCDDGNILGLFIHAHAGWFANGSGAFWQYQAQGQGASSWISYLQGAYVRVSANGGPATTSASMYIANSSGAPIYSYGFGSEWGPGNPAVSDTGAAGHGPLARFQLTMSGDGQRNTYNTMSVGGAVVEMFEASAPAISGSPQLSWTPGDWYAGGQPITANPTFLNTGFGVARNEWITYKPGDWVPQSRKVRDQALIFPQHGCDGTYLHRCNYSWQTEMAIPTAQMPEGINTVQLSALSPSGKGSDAWGNAYSYKVDHSAPALPSFGGSLASHDAGTVGAGSYTFYATGVDCAGGGAVSQRSGVQKVTVQFDASPEETFGPGSREVCSYTTPTRTWTLSAGEHVVRVTVTDWMGLVSTKTLTVTAVGAPTTTVSPVVAGVPNVGQTLTTTDGVWTGVPPIAYSYQWQRCDAFDAASSGGISTGTGCADITGARANSYTVTSADVGHSLRARVTATTLGGSNTQPSPVTNPVNADGTPPEVTLDGTLYDHRGGYLYDTSYDLSVSATDGAAGDVETGVASIEIRIDGAQKQFLEQDCLLGGCSMNSSFTLVTDDYADASHTVVVRVLDKAGNAAQRSFTFTVDRRGDVYHAKLYDDDPASGGQLLEEDWGRQGTKVGRSEGDQQVAARNVIDCPDNPGDQCGEVRYVTTYRATDPSAQETYTRYWSDDPQDDRLAIPASILSPVNDDLGSPTDRGPIGNAVASWQTLPPAYGSEYLKYEYTESVDGTPDGGAGDDANEDARDARRELWLDSATLMPLHERLTEISSGDVLEEMYYSYDPTRQTVGQLPADFFTPAKPSSVSSDKDVHFTTADKSSPQTDTETHQSFHAYSLGLAPTVAGSTFCLDTADVAHLHEDVQSDDPITVNAPEAGPGSPWAPDLTWIGAYYRPLTSGTCATSADDQQPIELGVRSIAKDSSYAAAFREVYMNSGERVAGDPTDPDFAFAGVQPVLLATEPVTAYVMRLDEQMMGAYLERGATALVLTGPFDKSTLPAVVALLEEV